MPQANSAPLLPAGSTLLETFVRRASRVRALARAYFVRFLAIYCLMASAPGAAEVVEDVVHFLSAGHTVHSSSDHAGETEHGCSGFFHVCQCCSQAQALPCLGLGQVSSLRRATRQPLLRAEGAGLPGYRAPPFRPPTA